MVKHFDKESPEYLSNGHYLIDGDEFMSVYTFKVKHQLEPNSNSINGEESKELIASALRYHSCKPDFGKFDKVFIFTLTDLNGYFSF